MIALPGPRSLPKQTLQCLCLDRTWESRHSSSWSSTVRIMLDENEDGSVLNTCSVVIALIR
jgi:hypothetical protein